MAKGIKGITIEINGETKGLESTIKSVATESKSLQGELRGINALLKMDPSNADLQAQKHKVLAEAVAQSSDKLEILKKAQDDVTAAFENGEISEKRYRDFQREIVATEQELQRLTEEQKDFISSTSKLSTAGKRMQDFGGKVKGVGEDLKEVSLVFAGMGAAALATIPATEEFRTDLSKLEQNAKDAGVGIDDTTEAFNTFMIASDEVDSSVEATSNLLAAGFKGNNLQLAVEGLTGAYMKFPDTLKVEGLADGLQETLATGAAIGPFAEMLDRVGVGTENFNSQLAACTTEAEKQQLVLDTLAKAGLMETYEAWRKANPELAMQKDLQLELQHIAAKLAETIAGVVLPVLVPLVQKAKELVEKFSGLSTGAKRVIVGAVALIASLAPALIIFGTLAENVGRVATIFARKAAATAVDTVATGTNTVATETNAVATNTAARAKMALNKAMIGLKWVAIGAAALGFIAILVMFVRDANAAEAAILGFVNKIQDFATAFVAMIPRIVEALVQMLPVIIQAGIDIVIALVNGLVLAIPQLVAAIPTIINALLNVLLVNLPLIIQAGVQILIGLINGLVQAIPILVEMLPTIITTIIDILVQNIPMIIAAGIQLLVALINGLIKAIPQLVKSLPKIISAIVSGLASLAGALITSGKNLISKLLSGISGAIGRVLDYAKGIPGRIASGIGDGLSAIFDVGKNMVEGLWNGIKNKTDWILGKVKGFGKSVVNGIKDWLGIKSPSTVMRDLIGVNMVLGIGVGIEKSTSKLLDTAKGQMKRLKDVYSQDFMGNTSLLANEIGPGGTIINQTVNIHQTVKTPEETARALRQARNFGVVGV